MMTWLVVSSYFPGLFSSCVVCQLIPGNQHCVAGRWGCRAAGTLGFGCGERARVHWLQHCRSSSVPGTASGSFKLNLVPLMWCHSLLWHVCCHNWAVTSHIWGQMKWVTGKVIHLIYHSRMWGLEIWIWKDRGEKKIMEELLTVLIKTHLIKTQENKYDFRRAHLRLL